MCTNNFIAQQLLNPPFSKMADVVDIDVLEYVSSSFTTARIFDNFCLSVIQNRCIFKTKKRDIWRIVLDVKNFFVLFRKLFENCFT